MSVSAVQQREDLYFGNEVTVQVHSEYSSFWWLGVTLRKGKTDPCYTHIKCAEQPWFWLDLPSRNQGGEDTLYRKGWERDHEHHENQRQHGCCMVHSTSDSLRSDVRVLFSDL